MYDSDITEADAMTDWGDLADMEYEAECEAEEAEFHDKYIEDLKHGRVKMDRTTYISSKDLLYIAEHRLTIGLYNSKYKEAALKIISDGNARTEGQRRCLMGFIRAEKKASKKSKKTKTEEIKKSKRAVFKLKEIN